MPTVPSHAWQRAVLRCCVGVCAVLLCASVAHADDLIKVPSGQTQTWVRQADDSYVASILVQSPKNIAALEPVKVLDVKYEDGLEEIDRDALGVEIRPVAEHVAILSVVLKTTARERLPGRYGVALQIAANGVPPQFLELTLVRPAPVLALRSTVYIDDRRRDCELCRGAAASPGSFAIRETSGKASLTRLEVEPDIDPKSWANAAPTARICLSTDSSPATTAMDPCPKRLSLQVPANSERVIYARTQGYFPPGIYTAKIDVRTPQLTSIAACDVQIVSRRSLLWILGTVAGGVLFGWFVRIYLTLVKDSADARIRASVALQAIRTSLGKIGDPRFQAQIREVERQLQTAAATGKPAEIIAAAIDANTRMDGIEKELEAALAALAADLSLLHELLCARWDLPSDVQTTLTAVRSDNDAVVRLMIDNNPQGAAQRLEAMKTGSLATTVAASVAWRRPLARCVTALVDLKPALATQDVSRLPPYAEVFRGDSNAVANPVVDLRTTHAELVASHRALFIARQCFSQVIDALVRFKDMVDPSLRALSQPDKAEALRYDAATEKLVRALQDPARTLADHDIQLVADCIAEQRAAWNELATAHLAPQAAQKCARSIEAGQWEDVLHELESAQTIETLDAAPVTPRHVTPGVLTGPVTAAVPAQGNTQSRSWQRPPVVLEGTAEERRRLRRNMLVAAAVQSLLVGSVFLCGAYALNSDTWIGDSKEIATLFLMAFGVDLTADGVLAALKRS